MKKIIPISLILAVIIPFQLVFAPPSENPDWPDYPYCAGGCSLDYLKQEWLKYAQLKDHEWLEMKKTEMLAAIKNGTLEEWLYKEPDNSNNNAWAYYFFKGEVPAGDGKYVDEHYSDQIDSENVIQIGTGEALFGDSNIANIVIISILLGVVAIIIVLFRRNDSG